MKLVFIFALIFSANCTGEFRYGRQNEMTTTPMSETSSTPATSSTAPAGATSSTAASATTPSGGSSTNGTTSTTPAGASSTSATSATTISPTGGITNLGPDGKVQFATAGGTIVMQPGNVFAVSSSRSQRSLISGIGRMRSWDFVANQCRLGVMCPCINLPPSYNCLSSYVKIRTGVFYDLQRFCGGNAPNQPIQSDTGELSILFKPDSSGITNSLFKCIVTCPPASNTNVTFPAGTTTCP